MEGLELIDYWEEDGREIEHYRYKGHDIFLNIYGEYEASIDGYWYDSVESACRKINEKEWYDSLSKDSLNFIKEYESRKFCSSLNDTCPYKEDCENCSVKKAIEIAKKIGENDKIKYNNIMSKKP